MIRTVKYLAIGLVAILIGDITVAWWQHSRTIVVLVNRSGQEIYAARLGVSEKIYDVGQVAPGGSKTVQVLPVGESAITLTFETATKKDFHWNGGYIGSSGGYKSVVTVGENFEVSEHASLRYGYVVVPLIFKCVRHGRV